MKNNQPKKVLFVCSDNYTRSVTAEFCLRNFLLKNNLSTIQSFSAGTQANSDTSKYYNVHFDRMKELDIDFSTFERKQFDRSFFDIYDLIVGMGQEHKDYFLSEYQQKIPLFNEVYKNEATSIVVAKPGSTEDIPTQLKQMVDYINDAIPQFVKNIEKWT
jgi:protein-tyrosine-phosphatase